jgi:hypothetical protein
MFNIPFFSTSTKQKTNKLRGPYSASELYRMSDCHLSAKFNANFWGWKDVAWSARRITHGRYSQFSIPEPIRLFHVAPHLSSRGWVDPVADPLLRKKICSAGNRTRGLWVSSQELWLLDYRGSPPHKCPINIKGRIDIMILILTQP